VGKLLSIAAVCALASAGVAFRPAPEVGPKGVATAPPATIAAVGDSITAGYLAPVSWPSLIGRWDKAKVTDLGHPGWATATMAEHFADAIASGAEVITIMGGTNDCAYGVPVDQVVVNVASMVRAARDAGRRAVVIGPLPRAGSDSAGAPHNDCLLSLRAAESRYAAANRVMFVDPWPAFSGPTAFQALYVDGTHPNARGALVLARVVARSFGWI
jgi:lysophospholipase L1-like esterase